MPAYGPPVHSKHHGATNLQAAIASDTERKKLKRGRVVLQFASGGLLPGSGSATETGHLSVFSALQGLSSAGGKVGKPWGCRSFGVVPAVRQVAKLELNMTAKRLWPMAAVVAGTIGLAQLCFLLRATAVSAAMLLLFGVLLAAIFLKLQDALAASITATLCLDYFFIPPIKQITIGDLQGWFSLAIFIGVSLLTANLSTRVRQQRDELINQQSEKEKLYALTRAMLLMGGESVRRLIVNKSMELFGFSEVALFESSSGLIQRSETPGTFNDEMLKRAATLGAIERRDEARTTVVPIALGNQIFGSLGFAGKILPEMTVQVLVNTVAVALAQAQAQEASSRANAVRQSEELKSVMIDALAHDLKTPLTVIEAASDMLLNPGELPAEQKQDLAQVVKEETTGLRRMMEEAIHLARIDAKKLKLEAEAVPVSEIVKDALRALGERASSRAVRVNIAAELTPVFVDRELMVQALKQIIDNALKYSPAGSTVSIGASEANGLIAIAVRDEGSGLTEMEQARVFEKYYRGRQDGFGAQGTGMGLSIAREIAEAHGGSMSVESQIGRGTRFTMTLRAAVEKLAMRRS